MLHARAPLHDGSVRTDTGKITPRAGVDDPGEHDEHEHDEHDEHEQHDHEQDKRDEQVRSQGDTRTLRQLPDTDLQVYPLALGGSVFGWTADGSTSYDILDRHHALGGNFVDTADSYAAGRSEVILGGWMRSRRTRDQTIVATKIGRNLDNPGLASRSIVGAVDASLERLQTDCIDVLYFHMDDSDVPLEESLGAVDVLVTSGKVRHIAASNFSAERLMEARVLAANGLPRFIALQSHYNLVHREAFEGELAVVTRAQGLGVMPYFALAHGFLTGKYRTKADVANTARGARAAGYLHRRPLKVLSTMERIAAEHNAPLSSVALAWLLSRDGVVAPVASASSPSQVEGLMAAAHISLTHNDRRDLDKISAWA